MLPPRDKDADEQGHDEPFATESTPPPSATTIIDLVSTETSKITNVNLYTNSRAEITRVFRLTLDVSGAHQFNILGLPRTLDRESLRVESRGAAKPTIHDVSVSTIVPPPPSSSTTSPLLASLQSKEIKINKSLKRTHIALSSLNSYLSSVNASGLDASKLQGVVREYDAVAGELDEQVLSLEDELETVRNEINEERQRLSKHTSLDPALNTKATVVVFAEFTGEMEIVLIYAVSNATWNAGYDIRVSTTASSKPITLIYKALISQSTGEPWPDVPLTLHTSAPTFGADVQVPVLYPWAVYIYRPEIHGSLGGGGARKKMASFAILDSSSRLDEEKSRPKLSAPPSAAIPPPPPPPPLPEMKHRGLQVSSAKGGVSATFSVPGLITIPSDTYGSPASWHNVTIATLTLDAKMSWVCVPKKDTRVHLNAKVKNASEYTFLPGSASVYVDGSFISKSDIPLVSPEERFDCPLGVDPAIRVTYHPRTKTVTRGSSALKFYASNTTKHVFAQRITVHNTKAPGNNNSNFDQGSKSCVTLKIIDQFPVSEDSTIRVKLVQPPLILPSSSTATNGGTEKKNQQSAAESRVGDSVTVSPGVTARWDWDGAEDDNDDDGVSSIGNSKKTEAKKKEANDLTKIATAVDPALIGKDGRFLWDCSIPPQGRVGLTMQWEVVVPTGAPVNVDGV